MTCIQNHDFHDGTILSIHITDKAVEVLFEKWDTKKIKLYFEDYCIIEDCHSIGRMVDELLQNSSERLKNDAMNSILDDGASEKEGIGLNSFSFVGAWEGKAILTIVSKGVRVESSPV
jgi:hypothetical protein